MAVDKKINYEKNKPAVQGGVENYLGRQPEVQAPRKWKSSPDKPETELAYITKAEKDLILKANIHGGLEKGPNMGPSGIMSLDSFGDIGGAGAAGVDTDASGGYDTGPGGGGFTGQGPNESRQDFANRKDAQRANLQRAERAQAGRLGYNERANISNLTYGPKTNKFGSVLSGLMGLFNPAFGFISKGVGSIKDKLQDLRGYNPDGTPRTQKEYEDARRERQLSGRLDNLYDRKLTGKDFSQANIDMLEAMGITPSQNSLKSAIDRDLAINPEMPQFATSYLNSINPTNIEQLAKPNINQFTNPNVPTGIQSMDVDLPGNNLMATLATNSPALAQYRSLQKKQVLSNMGGPEFTAEDQQKLNQLEQMKADPDNVYSQTI